MSSQQGTPANLPRQAVPFRADANNGNVFYVSTATPQGQLGASPIYVFPAASTSEVNPVRFPLLNVQATSTNATQQNVSVRPASTQVQQPATVNVGNQTQPQSQWMYNQMGSSGTVLTNVPLVLSTISPNICQTSPQVSVSQQTIQEQIRNLSSLVQGASATQTQTAQSAGREKSTNELLAQFFESVVSTATTEAENNTALALALTLYGPAFSSAIPDSKLPEAQQRNTRLRSKAFNKEAIQTVLSECIKPCLEKGATNLLGGNAMEVAYGRRPVDPQALASQGKRQKA